jgi:hypothetical protein
MRSGRLGCHCSPSLTTIQYHFDATGNSGVRTVPIASDTGMSTTEYLYGCSGRRLAEATDPSSNTHAVPPAINVREALATFMLVSLLVWPDPGIDHCCTFDTGTTTCPLVRPVASKVVRQRNVRRGGRGIPRPSRLGRRARASGLRMGRQPSPRGQCDVRRAASA